MCLAFLVYKGFKMKLGSCCRESKMQFSGPTLRSLGNFYIELNQFYCSFSAGKACIWNIRPDNKSPVSKVFFKTSQSAYGPQFFCVDHDLARILCQEQYFHACTLWATQARVGGGRVKKCFFEISLFEQQIGISQYFSRRWEHISSRLKKKSIEELKEIKS